MLKYQTSLRNGIIRVHGCCGVYAVAGTAEEYLMKIKNSEHNHPFFGAKLNEHKSTFNGLVANNNEHANTKCRQLFWNYRSGIIEGLNREASLDSRAEGAQCGVNPPPTKAESNELQKNIQDLDELRDSLISCMRS